jgi:hypothetical protein
MLIRIKINKNTFETTSDDSEVVFNRVDIEGDFIEIELSKPDPELNTFERPSTWQQLHQPHLEILTQPAPG